MFLLIQLSSEIIVKQKDLHSTMFLLIPAGGAEQEDDESYLHSTMFLLIHDKAVEEWINSSFTFHNVSINSKYKTESLTVERIYIPQCFY